MNSERRVTQYNVASALRNKKPRLKPSHAFMRLRERLPTVRPSLLSLMQARVASVELPSGDHYARLGPGSVVLKDIGDRHVVATVLGPEMTRRPGVDVTHLLEKRAVYAAFSDEMQKISEYRKEAIFETLRSGFKAAKQAIFGGKKLTAGPGAFLPQRQAAVSAGDDLINGMEGSGLKIHRGRVKSPESIMGKGGTGVPDDLLGMQAYAKGPEDVARYMKGLRDAGVDISESTALTRPGYHGINIKGNYKGTPMEMQLSPGRLSNMGTMMSHNLAYKPKTEAPWSNAFDRWFGDKVAPKMISGGSWLPSNKPQLAGMGIR